MNDEQTSDERSADVAASAGAHRAAHRVRPRWRILLIGCALAAAALLIDQAVTDRLTDEGVSHRIERLIKVPLNLGPCLIILAILASFPNRWRLCVGFLTPVLLQTLVLHSLKWAIGRARPLLELGAFHFEPFAGAKYCDAFPSGHTASAGTLALLLGIYFPRARWVFYFMAALVGLERIVTDWHFLSDVLAGYVLAALAVYACIRVFGPTFYQKDWQPTPKKSA